MDDQPEYAVTMVAQCPELERMFGESEPETPKESPYSWRLFWLVYLVGAGGGMAGSFGMYMLLRWLGV